jgi:N-terminal domain of (some) glycogen debranching enzymes
MAFKVQVGPAQIAIHQGQSVLLTEPDGQVNSPSNRGLYFRDTRVISAWAIYANGEPWVSGAILADPTVPVCASPSAPSRFG